MNNNLNSNNNNASGVELIQTNYATVTLYIKKSEGYETI